MASLVVMVLDDLSKLATVVHAWEEAGVPGITMLDSIGSRSLQEHVRRDDLPLLPSLRSLLLNEEVKNCLLFAVVDDDAVLERAIEAAHRTVGDFTEPNTGVLFVLPVSRAWGIQKHRRSSGTATQ